MPDPNAPFWTNLMGFAFSEFGITITMMLAIAIGALVWMGVQVLWAQPHRGQHRTRPCRRVRARRRC